MFPLVSRSPHPQWEERDADKNGQILELTEKVLELEGRVESMSDKLCHCARPAEVVVGDGSAEAPFELEYADEEGSGSSDGSNHTDQGSSKYFEPRQVSVEGRSMLRIIEDSPEPAGPSNGHWGQGDLETSGNILGKLWALDHFSPNVSTNRILGTFRL